MSDPPGTYTTADGSLCSPATRPRSTRHPERTIAEIKREIAGVPEEISAEKYERQIGVGLAQFLANAQQYIEDLIAIIEEAPS